MKNVRIIVLIALSFVLGAFTASASAQVAQIIKNIEVPEYIQGYNTIDLLNYVATLKKQADLIKKQELQRQERLKELKNPTCANIKGSCAV